MTSPVEPDRPSGTPEFYASLATMTVAAGCLFVDDSGRVLLVNPTYKARWEIPGGAVEAGESPLAACIRELREELGWERVPERLMCVDYRAPVPGARGDALRFVFFGGVLGDAETATLRLPPDELSEWRFAEADELESFTAPVMARRIRACLASPHTVYLEDGEPAG